ncbi:hypothetical protein BDV12DRAFT_202813 [Aspergillus spectabilis]
MKNFLILFSGGLGLAPIASATATTTTQTSSAPQVTIFDKPNYEGDRVSFEPDTTCQTILPRWIESVSIPENEEIYCQLFETAYCTGEGGDLIIASQPDLPDEPIYPGIICGVLSSTSEGKVKSTTFFHITETDEVYFGRSSKNKREISIDEFNSALERVQDDDIYPNVPTDADAAFTIPPEDLKDSLIYIKRPELQ